MPLRARLVALVALVGPSALVACHPAEDFEKDRQRAYCEAYVRCGTYPDVDLCVSLEFPAGPDPYLASAIAAGRIHYEAGAAGKCLKAIRKLDCTYREDWNLEVSLACAEVFEGTLPPEAECLDTRECGPGSRCGFDPTCVAADACCPGHCRYLGEADPPKIGEACTGECIAGSFCEGGFCVSLRGEGGPCDYDGECAPPGFCDYDEGGSHCRHAVPTGDSCRPESGDSLPCLHADDYCAQDGRCRPRGRPGDECEYYDGCIGYTSCVNGVCTERRREGESCNYSNDSYCYSGLYCEDSRCIRDEVDPIELCTLD
ncbi:MAG: hypothetical protein R3B09_18545 [Nannocystaceae bacterium]